MNYATCKINDKRLHWKDVNALPPPFKATPLVVKYVIRLHGTFVARFTCGTTCRFADMLPRTRCRWLQRDRRPPTCIDYHCAFDTPSSGHRRLYRASAHAFGVGRITVPLILHYPYTHTVRHGCNDSLTIFMRTGYWKLHSLS